MARIVYSMMVSLDGYIAEPDGDIGLPVPEADLHRHFDEMMEQTSMELRAADVRGDALLRQPGAGGQ